MYKIHRTLSKIHGSSHGNAPLILLIDGAIEMIDHPLVMHDK
jgi:hypothetical protein